MQISVRYMKAIGVNLDCVENSMGCITTQSGVLWAQAYEEVMISLLLTQYKILFEFAKMCMFCIYVLCDCNIWHFGEHAAVVTVVYVWSDVIRDVLRKFSHYIRMV